MATLSIHVDRFFEGGALEQAGAVAEIVRLDDPDWYDPALSTVMVPAGQAPHVRPAEVDLPAGRYMVQTRLPTGRIVNRHVDLRDGQDARIVIEAERSANEFASWQTYLGDAPTAEQLERTAFLSGRSAPEPAEAAPPTRAHDLTRLKGVGRTFARRLRERGINNLSELAGLTPQQVDWMMGAVPGIGGRRDGTEFLREARELLGGTNRPPRRPRAAEVAPEAEAPAAAADAETRLRRPRQLAEPPADGGDDLTQIRGIGPKLERLLKDNGVFLLRQIADLEDEESAWLDTLPSYRGRIYRDDWVGQARALTDKSDTPLNYAPAQPEPERTVVASTGDDATGAEPAPFCMSAAGGHAFYRLDGTVDPPVSLLHALNVAADADEDDSQRMAWLLSGSSGLGSPLPKLTALSHLASINSSGPVTVISVPPGLPHLPTRVDRREPLWRPYVLVEDGGTQWLTALPYPWTAASGGNPVAIDVTSNVGGARPMLSVLPRDPVLAPLFGYLRAGDHRASGMIIGRATESLFGKLMNPYAAALGGLVLVAGLRAGMRVEKSDRWQDWIRNLSDWFPWLSDADVMRAWLALMTGAEPIGTARSLLLSASRDTVPVYTQSLRLLVEGLRRFHRHDPDDVEIAQALSRLDRAALCMDLRSVFTTMVLRSCDGPQSDA